MILGQTRASDHVRRAVLWINNIICSMGEAELQPNNNLLIIHAVINTYGDAANEESGIQIAADFENY